MSGENLILTISIHAPREGGDVCVNLVCIIVRISIHAPREGGDANYRQGIYHVNRISIHAPREGGDAYRNTT